MKKWAVEMRHKYVQEYVYAKPIAYFSMVRQFYTYFILI